jgi:two-component system sensor histidine kinase QseC
MTSLRRRTLGLVLGLLLLGAVLVALYNFHDSKHELGEIYDAQLAQTARLLQGVMEMSLASGDTREQLYRAFNDALSHASGHPSIGHPYERKMAFQVWSEQGASLVHSASVPAFDAPLRTPGFSNLDLGERRWRGFLLPDHKQGLLIWVGERDDVRQDLASRIVRHTLEPNMFGIVVLAVLVWLAIGWGLRPLQNMAQIIRARHADSLEPLQLVPLPIELEPMQAALNRLLSQVETVLQRERRFIADAAHEMRTPLAVLRIHAQNAMQATSDTQRRESLDFLVVGVDRLTRVVNQLLTMARVEPELAKRNWRPVDLESVARETLAELTPWILGKGLEVSFDVSGTGFRTTSDAGAIEIALQNLVTNAANFSPPGGQIKVALSDTGTHFVLSVEDQGPGIDEKQIARLFERFYTRDNPEGAGLGLAIVEMIANRLDGQVTIENRDDGGLRATLRLPKENR